MGLKTLGKNSKQCNLESLLQWLLVAACLAIGNLSFESPLGLVNLKSVSMSVLDADEQGKIDSP